MIDQALYGSHIVTCIVVYCDVLVVMLYSQLQRKLQFMASSAAMAPRQSVVSTAPLYDHSSAIAAVAEHSDSDDNDDEQED
jgi:hypothetical protein